MWKKLTSTALALIMVLSLVTFIVPSADALVSGNYEYNVKDKKAYITKYTGKAGKLTIPGTLDGLPVVSIDWRAFAGNTSLTSVTIPGGITSIGIEAFDKCTSLTSVTIPNSVTTIGRNAFSNCTALTSITVPKGVAQMGEYAFYNCTALKSATIANGASSISSNAFSKCSSLTSVTIPNSVTSIGTSAFENCVSLAKVSIPKGVKTIGEKAFQGCTALKSVTIAEGVTTINTRAFAKCVLLTSVTIPKSVTSIESWSFDGCSNLVITCHAGSYAHTFAKDRKITTKLIHVTYTVKFSKGSGSGSWNTLTKNAGSTVNITAKCAASFTRKGYVFAHFLGSDGKTYKSGSKVTVKSNLTLTAEYSKVSAPSKAVTSLSLKSEASKQLSVSYKGVSGAQGYRIEYSTDNKFSKATTTITYISGTSITLVGLTAKKKYYVRVTAYKIDSTKAKIYSKKTATKNLTIK